jgi:hypothetical protein
MGREVVDRVRQLPRLLPALQVLEPLDLCHANLLAHPTN